MIPEKLKRVFFSSSLFLLVCCSSQTQENFKTATWFSNSKEDIDQYIQSRMNDLNIPGLSFAIISKGEVFHQGSFGYANREQKKPVTEETIFEAASLSKSVFAFFTMTYVDEGKLNLDQPLYTYLPYPDIEYDERYKKITARMVLSHRSGFPNWRSMEPDKKLKIKFEPGTDYLYSGEGYQYLAMVLKHIDNTDWEGLEETFQNKIAKPLGMEHTVFIQTPYTRNHKADPYDENSDWIDWQNDFWFNYADGKFGAASSLHTEPLDFSKWMIAVMNQELLSEKSYQELFSSHSVVPSSGVIDLDYTLGFIKPHLPFNTEIYFHTGNNTGYTGMFALDPKKNWGFVLLTNSEYGSVLGEGLLFYLLTGIDITTFWITVSVISLTILAGVIWMTYRFVKK